MQLHTPAIRKASSLLVMALSIQFSAIAQQVQRIEVPAGTVIPVKLNEEISTKTALVGDKFSATVQYDPNYIEFPQGSVIDGYVKSVQTPSSDTPASLDVAFTRVRLPNGTSVKLNGTLASLDSKSVKRTTTGRLISANRKDDTPKFIAYGAGAGLVIGLLTKKTLEGTLLGALGGYIYGTTQKNKTDYKDLVVKKDTDFGIRINQRVVYNLEPAYKVGKVTTADYNYNGDITTPPTATIVTPTIPPSTSVNGIGVMIDDREIPMGKNRPYLYKNTVLVPLVDMANALNAPYIYDSKAKSLTIDTKDGRSKIGLNSSIALIGKERVKLNAPAIMKNGSLYVPIQFISLATGMTARYDDVTQTVVFSTGEIR